MMHDGLPLDSEMFQGYKILADCKDYAGRYVIYGLVASGKIYYVGQTIDHQRLRQQLKGRSRTRGSSNFYKWARQNDLSVSMVILCDEEYDGSVEQADRISDMEYALIEKGRGKLFNIGGRGPGCSDELRSTRRKFMLGPGHPRRGIPHKESTKLKLRLHNLGKTYGKSTREKLSAISSGSGNNMYGVPSPMKGRKHLDSSKAKMSDACKARWQRVKEQNLWIEWCSI